jgi:DNA-binding XRE family transcriptional regulator
VAVYFIQAGDAEGLIKIGYARTVSRRLADLQRFSAIPLRLLRSIAGNLDTERAIHSTLASHRAHGEWFRPTQMVLAMVKTVVDDAGAVEWSRDQVDAAAIAKQVRALRELSGLSRSQLAQRCSTKQPNIARLEGGAREPTLNLLTRIAKATGHRLVVTFERLESK